MVRLVSITRTLTNETGMIILLFATNYSNETGSVCRHLLSGSHRQYTGVNGTFWEFAIFRALARVTVRRAVVVLPVAVRDAVREAASRIAAS